MENFEIKKVNMPLTQDAIKDLHAYDKVLISGVIYTARDEAHEKIIEMLERKEKIPIDLKNQTIYYAGPAPAQPGEVIGSCGPTTSGRMDKYTPDFINIIGINGMIGKGKRNEKVKDAIKEKGAVYFVVIGGLGALVSSCIKKSEVVLFPELDTEAIRRLEVENMPAIVAIDSYGKDIYE